MSDEATRNALRAVLTKAADAEAARQRAVRDGDHERAAAYEREILDLYRQHAEIEAQAGRAA